MSGEVAKNTEENEYVQPMTCSVTESSVLSNNDSNNSSQAAKELFKPPVLHEHSNENLLKIDTHDKYSTVNALKKQILKSLEARQEVTNGENNDNININNENENESESNMLNKEESSSSSSLTSTLFHGLLRMNKNPHSPYLFMAFATPEDRSHALNILTTIAHRKKTKWVEVNVTDRDLALTHKGKPHKRTREEMATHIDNRTCESKPEELENVLLETQNEYNDEENRKNNGNNNNNNYRNNKNSCTDNKLADYAHLTIAEQHNLKYKHCWSILKTLLWSLFVERPELANSLSSYENTSMKCIIRNRTNELFQGVIASPISKGYRNHVNFSFGYDEHKRSTIGFNKGAVIDGTAAIEPVTYDISHSSVSWKELASNIMEHVGNDHSSHTVIDVIALTTHPIARLIATAIMRVCRLFEESEPSCETNMSNNNALLNSEQVTLYVYDKLRDDGFWRKLQVRHNVRYEAMVAITVNEDEFKWIGNRHINNNNSNSSSSNISSTKFTSNITVHHKEGSEIEEETTKIDKQGAVAHIMARVKEAIVEALTSEDFTQCLQKVCECSSARVVSIHYFTWTEEHKINTSTSSELLEERTMSQTDSGNNNKNIIINSNNHMEYTESTENYHLCREMTIVHNNGKNYEERDYLLYGSPTLTEYVCNLRFELSPCSFFQVNTPGMELLLNKLITVASLHTSRSSLLDLCCGTGTIGLVLAQYVKRVIGIELIDDAVINARANCTLNQIHNATFHVGRVEHVLPSVIQSLLHSSHRNNSKGESENSLQDDEEEFIAILDPPRAGVTSTVLKWVRGTAAITKVIYISCDQSSLLRDCPFLTKPPSKAYRGVPFNYTAAFAVDLFPHTRHVEMVVVLSRDSLRKMEEKQQHQNQQQQ